MAYECFELEVTPRLSSPITTIIPNEDAKLILDGRVSTITISAKLCHDKIITSYVNQSPAKQEKLEGCFNEDTTVALGEPVVYDGADD